LAQAHHVDPDGNDLTDEQRQSVLQTRAKKKTSASAAIGSVNQNLQPIDGSAPESINIEPGMHASSSSSPSPKEDFVVLDEDNGSAEAEADIEPHDPSVQDDLYLSSDAEVEITHSDEERAEALIQEEKVTGNKKATQKDRPSEDPTIRKKTRPSKVLAPLAFAVNKVVRPFPTQMMPTSSYNPRARRNLITRESLLVGLQTLGNGSISMISEKLTQRHMWTPDERSGYELRLADIRRGQIATAEKIRQLIPVDHSLESLLQFLKDVDQVTKRQISERMPDDE